jgi:hypothetical protein
MDRVKLGPSLFRGSKEINFLKITTNELNEKLMLLQRNFDQNIKVARYNLAKYIEAANFIRYEMYRHIELLRLVNPIFNIVELLRSFDLIGCDLESYGKSNVLSVREKYSEIVKLQKQKQHNNAKIFVKIELIIQNILCILYHITPLLNSLNGLMDYITTNDPKERNYLIEHKNTVRTELLTERQLADASRTSQHSGGKKCYKRN